MSERPISQWYGVTTNPSGRLILRLDLSDNGLFGEIPPELGELSGLEYLNLAENQLRGGIPSELANLANLETLALFENQLREEIPPELGNLTYLQILNLHTNQLEGEIPPELGNLENLRILYLSGNRLHGEIPLELENLTSLERLGLANNRLQGDVPHFLGDLPHLETLFLNGNTELNGCLPEGSKVPFCTLPGNLNAKRENGTTVLTWDPVEGATHYNIYWEDFFASCGVTSGGAVTGWCEVLALDVFDTTYVHTTSDTDADYWVAACNDDGCSPIFGSDPGASP